MTTPSLNPSSRIRRRQATLLSKNKRRDSLNSSGVLETASLLAAAPRSSATTGKPSTKRIRELILEHAPFFKQLLQVGDWKVTFRIEENPDGETNAASVVTDINYRKATIRIHPEYAASEDDVIDSIRHELLHLLFEPYDLYREAVRHLLAVRDLGAEDRLWVYAMERTLLNFERTFDNGVYPLLRQHPPGVQPADAIEVL